MVRAGLEPSNSGFQVRSPNHLASLSLQYFFFLCSMATLSDLHSLWTQTDIRLFSRNLSVFAGYELHSKIKILTIDWPWLFPQNLQAVHLGYSWYPSGLSGLDESVLGNNHDQQMGYIHCNFQFLYIHVIIWRKTWYNYTINTKWIYNEQCGNRNHEFKVHLTPKYFFFCLNKSLYLFEMDCTFLPRFNPNLDLLQSVKVMKSGHHLSDDQASKGYGSIPALTSNFFACMFTKS